MKKNYSTPSIVVSEVAPFSMIALSNINYGGSNTQSDAPTSAESKFFSIIGDDIDDNDQ